MSAKVIGLDLSITATGTASATGELATISGLSHRGDRRLQAIHEGVVALLLNDPHLVVIEDLPTHAHGAGITGMVHGVVRWACLEFDVPYVLVPPATLKKYATGRGNATKSDMRMELFRRTGLDVRDDNQADAWWLRAMGLDYLGDPAVELPAAQRTALGKVDWASLGTVAL